MYKAFINFFLIKKKNTFLTKFDFIIEHRCHDRVSFTAISFQRP